MGKVVIEIELDAVPTESEIQAVDALVKNKIPKEHVLFLKPNRRKGSNTPDIEIDHNLRWEIKTPKKNGKYTFEHAIRAGLNQSENLVFDLRRIKTNEDNAVRKLRMQFDKTKSWQRLIIIKKDQKYLTFNKQSAKLLA
jgi:hypothetical protein